MLYKAGVDVKAAQYLLGHSRININMDIYTYLDESKKQRIKLQNTYQIIKLLVSQKSVNSKIHKK